MRSILRKSARIGAALALVLAASVSASSFHSVQAQPASAGPNADWPIFGGSTDHTSYSPLTQINASNVNQLGLAWTQQEGPNLSYYETVPTVINGVMYYTTNTDNVRAVNAATGKLISQYTPT